jgi:hypothetical protein
MRWHFKRRLREGARMLIMCGGTYVRVEEEEEDEEEEEEDEEEEEEEEEVVL